MWYQYLAFTLRGWVPPPQTLRVSSDGFRLRGKRNFFVRFAFSFVYAIVFSCARAEASKVRVRVIPSPV